MTQDSDSPALSRGIRLLDAEPEFGRDLSEADFEAANRLAVFPATALEVGPCALPAALAAVDGVHGDVRGFLLRRGAITVDLSITGRACSRLITPGELVLLDGVHDDSMPLRWGWSVLEPADLVVIDDRLLLVAARWPPLLAAIVRRAAEQLGHSLMQQAIGQLPRVEDRLMALMWSIADRRGTVGVEGIHVHLPVSHDTLARMIGAQRPTVSLGLKTLAEDGQLVQVDDGWVLDPTTADRFATA